jgi:photosystem II stability/assembly factor-like uncharacterized protein
VQGIVVEQGFAYLAAGWGGLVVVDVADPSRPVAVAKLRGDYSVAGLALEGSTAYLAAGEAGLLIVDVSDPAAPTLLGLLDTPAPTEAVAVSDTTAFLAAGESGLWFVDVSDPAHPTAAALPELLELTGPVLVDYYLSASLQFHDVALAGNLLFAAVGDDGDSPFSKGLRILDVAEPGHPRPVGSFTSWERPSRLELSGSLALFLDVSGYPSPEYSLQVIDVSNPADPGSLASYGSDHEVFDLFVDGTLVYLANGARGLQLIDLREPAHPRRIGAYEPTTQISGYAAHVEQGLAYLADGESGLRIVDVSDPSSPVTLSLFDTPGFAIDVIVSGQTAFIADTGGGLRPLDVTDPFQPRELAVPESGQEFYEVDLADGYLLARNGHGDLFVLPLEGTWEAGLELVLEEAEIVSLHASGNLGYAATYTGGLRLLDLSDPLQPVDLSWLTLDEDVSDVAASGAYAYLATEDFMASLDGETAIGSLRVVDVSDPYAPREAGSLGLPAFASAVAASGSWVAVGDERGWVYLLDVSNPREPVQVDSFHTPVLVVLDLDFVGSSLFVSGDGVEAILRVGEVPALDLQAAAPPPPVPTPVQLRYALEFLEPPAAVPARTISGSRVGITQLSMVTAESGWAQGGLNGDTHPKLLRTTDGGHTWVDVTPPEPQLQELPGSWEFRSLETFFWDERRAWAIFDDTPRVWRTRDGGASWEASAALPLDGIEGDYDLADEYLHPMTLTFTDLSNGWISVNETQAMMQGDLELLRTRDGGASWEHIYHGGILGYRGMAFLDNRTGWIADGEVSFSVETLQRTGDGGRSWERVTDLAGIGIDSVFARCRAYCPVHFLQVFPPRTAMFVLVDTGQDPEPQSALVVSVDGGLTWRERRLPAIPSSLEFIDARRGWLLSGREGRLFASEDGGSSWSEIGQVGWNGQLNFASEQLGWAIAWRPDESLWYQDLEGRALLRTSDGGRSWEQLQPQVVP